jgi:hypothetical protein
MLREHQALLGERLERGAVSGRVLEPRVLLLGGELANLAHQRGERLVVSGAVQPAIGNLEQLLEAIDLLQQPDALRDRGGTSYLQKQVTK